MFELVFDDVAKSDIREATAWYAEYSDEVAVEFLRELRRTLTFVRNNPSQYQSFKNSIHKAHLRRFPFNIFYHIIQDRIKVIACLHDSRNTTKILEERN
jgi:plasmid stabilization system protein ParE